MSKSYKDSTPLEKMTVDVEKPKRKVGRPATFTEKRRKINVAVPEKLLEQWDKVKIVHGNNLTGYITKLIEKDMDENYEKYLTKANNIKNILEYIK